MDGNRIEKGSTLMIVQELSPTFFSNGVKLPSIGTRGALDNFDYDGTLAVDNANHILNVQVSDYVVNVSKNINVSTLPSTDKVKNTFYLLDHTHGYTAHYCDNSSNIKKIIVPASSDAGNVITLGSDGYPFISASSIPNLYTSNGTLSSGRTVNLDSKPLNFYSTATNFFFILDVTGGKVQIASGASGGGAPENNALNVRFGGAGWSAMKTSNLTATRTHQLPNANGIFALSVNNITPDNAGNIELPISLQDVTTVGNITDKSFIRNFGSTFRAITNPVALHAMSSLSTGCIAITHPMVTGATFVEMNITIGSYQASNSRTAKYNIKFYVTGGGVNATWNLRSLLTGSNLPTGAEIVRVGLNDSGDIVVLIGDTSTNWNTAGSGMYVKVDEVILTHSNANSLAWETGWIITRNITSTTGYTLTSINTDEVFKGLSGSFSMTSTSVPANSMITLGTVTINGATTSSVAIATNPTTAGLLIKATVSATNTVTLYAVNITGSTITTPTATIQVKVFK